MKTSHRNIVILFVGIAIVITVILILFNRTKDEISGKGKPHSISEEPIKTGRKETAPTRAFNNPYILPLISSLVSICIVVLEGINTKDIPSPMKKAMTTIACKTFMLRM